MTYITNDMFSKDDLLAGVFNRVYDMEAVETAEIAEIAVDTTLQYVVDWLKTTGHNAKAEILEQLGDLQ